MSTDALLIALKLRGFASPATLETMVGAAVAHGLAELQADGLVSENKFGLRLTPAGQAAAADCWKAARGRIDSSAMAALYGDFHAPNADFKAVIADWQLRDEAINDHHDTAYDAAVLARLTAIDAAIRPLIARAAGLEPRLARYADRLAMALASIGTGDHRYVAAPLLDSYHTIWFELHEELIRLAGLSRAAEAAEGRA